MKRLIRNLAVALSLTAAAVAPAYAQAIPNGSYQQSCRDIRVRGGELTAWCNSTNGNRVHTSTSLNCNGDIANSNGQLVCNGNGYGNGYHHHHGYGNNGYGNNGYGNNGYNNGYGNNYGRGGSYQQSCNNIRQRGSQITASCPTANGQWMTTSIDANSCRGADVANINGRLQCH